MRDLRHHQNQTGAEGLRTNHGLRILHGRAHHQALPPAQTGGKDIPLHDIFEPSSKRYAEAREFRELYDSDPDVKRVTDEAMGIEGLIRQTGVHACATIMGSEPISNTSPLLERTDGTVTTTLEYHTCETLGLVKMDFLGLSNLTVIRDTLNNIEANGKTRIDHTKIHWTIVPRTICCREVTRLACSSWILMVCVRC